MKTYRTGMDGFPLPEGYVTSTELRSMPFAELVEHLKNVEGARRPPARFGWFTSLLAAFSTPAVR
jgi:hypothetical protein